MSLAAAASLSEAGHDQFASAAIVRAPRVRDLSTALQLAASMRLLVIELVGATSGVVNRISWTSYSLDASLLFYVVAVKKNSFFFLL